MTDDNALYATKEQVAFFRMWTGVPADYANTPRELATSVYMYLFRSGEWGIEACKLLQYMQGRSPIPLEHFKRIESVYMRP